MAQSREFQTTWLAARGFVSNDLDDQWKAFFQSASGNNDAGWDLADSWRKFLKNHGNTEGSLNDMYRQELIRSIPGGASSNLTIIDLENAFFSSTANTFA